MLPSTKFQNGAQIQDGRQNVNLIIFLNFLKIFYIWLIVHLFQKFFFSSKFKMAEQFNMADLLHKNSCFFGSGTAE
jgi:hypothetical protein